MATSNLLTYKVRDGWHMTGQYDYYDMDINSRTGYAWRGKILSEFYPTGYLEVTPGIEWNYRESGTSIMEYGTAEVQLHVWF